jgi:hypothetical protein
VGGGERVVTDTFGSRALAATNVVEGRMAEIQCITGEAMPNEGGLIASCVTYADGVEEQNRGSLLEVSTLASLAGLHLAHSSAGTFRYD